MQRSRSIVLALALGFLAAGLVLLATPAAATPVASFDAGISVVVTPTGGGPFLVGNGSGTATLDDSGVLTLTLTTQVSAFGNQYVVESTATILGSWASPALSGTSGSVTNDTCTDMVGTVCTTSIPVGSPQPVTPDDPIAFDLAVGGITVFDWTAPGPGFIETTTVTLTTLPEPGALVLLLGAAACLRRSFARAAQARD